MFEFGKKIISDIDSVNTQNVAINAQNVVTQTAIQDLSDSIPVLTETGGTVTTDGTEQTVYTNDAPAGLFSPKSFLMDFTAHTAGETVLVREYYRIKSGGNYIEYKETSYAGAQDPDLKIHSLFGNRFGIKVTAEKTGGTNRAYDWEVVYKL